VATDWADDPDSATAEFYINTADNPSLDHKSLAKENFGYCVFGKVVAGMDVVDTIGSVNTGSRGSFKSDVPMNDVIIKEVSRVK